MGRYAIIFGGQLGNKGAQAMSMLAVSALRKLMPGVEPLLISRMDAVQPFVSRIKGRREHADLENLTFNVVWADPSLLNIRSGTAHFPLKKRVNRVLRQAAYLPAMDKFERLVNEASISLDISGFTFGAQWGYEKCQHYLNVVDLMDKHDIPTYLLPQSFGPFVFSNATQDSDIRMRASSLLLRPRMICARERQGLRDILSLCPSARCTLEDDVVLQSEEVNPKDIFVDTSRIPIYPDIETDRNVGIVPNTRTFDYGNSTRLLALYGSLISGLTNDGYNVYIIQHSQDDAALCTKLKDMFRDKSHVILMGENRYCFQYAELFARCDFLVASRFHAIVHAYRCGVPCVALGWATKYVELLNRVGQDEYVHDVRCLDEDTVRGIFASVRQMEDRNQDESRIIRAHVADIQSKRNVFERVVDDFRELQKQ